jgi:hypothetical protein
MGRARLFWSKTQGRPAAGQPWAGILRTVGARLNHGVQNAGLRFAISNWVGNRQSAISIWQLALFPCAQLPICDFKFPIGAIAIGNQHSALGNWISNWGSHARA